MSGAKFQARAWFRHYGGARNDPKLQLLSFDDRAHWWALNEMKCEGELDKDDVPDELRERLIAKGLGLDFKTAADVKRRLFEVGLIDEQWQPRAWDKRQFEGDFSSDRVRRHRERQKGGGDVTLHPRSSNVTVTPSESESDTDKNPEGERAPVDKSTARSPGAEPSRTNRAQAATALQRISERIAARGGAG